MALITDREAPSDVPESDPDVLKDIVDPDAPRTDPAEIRLGSTVLMVMDTPPNTGDYLDIAMRVRIKRKAEDQNTPDSPLTYPRYAEIVVAWPLGEKMPKPAPKEKSKAEKDTEAEAEAAKNQPPLFDEDQEPAAVDDPGASRTPSNSPARSAAAKAAVAT